jgi:hypothetical protein
VLADLAVSLSAILEWAHGRRRVPEVISVISELHDQFLELC